MSRRRLGRRAFLGGAAAAVALPWLPSLAPRRAFADSHLPSAGGRFIAIFSPNGIHMPAWTPAATGADFALPEILAPLAPVRDQLLVISGLHNRNARAQVPGDHARGTGSFLTCTPVFKTEGDDISNGVSVDQVMAQALAGQTRFASLQLGLDGGGNVGNCDSGYSCAYTRNISWAGPSTPLPKEVSPQSVFDRLFAGFDAGLTAAQVAERRARRRSILDYVRGDLARLRPTVGADDAVRLDEYLTGVEELEASITAAAAETTCYPGPAPGRPADADAHWGLMNRLMVLALQCDLTRVISFMIGNGGSNAVHQFLGVGEAHHYLSHHQGDPYRHEQLATINTWSVRRLADLMERLRAVPDGDATLLDRTTIFFSSDIEDGDTHAHTNLPVLVCGGGDGAWRSGRHVRVTGGAPLADLFIAMLHAMGVAASDFGNDGTGPLAGVS